jgi:FAD-linked sulfhydryl oxidase
MAGATGATSSSADKKKSGDDGGTDDGSNSNSNSNSNSSDGKEGCPLNKQALGHMTWSFLHTTAAYYPPNPTPVQKQAAVNLVNSVATLYSCEECRVDFVASTKAKPPVKFVNSAKDFSQYVCELHNEVNVKLGKDVFSCDFKDLERRWKNGCGFGDYVPE